MALHTQLGLSKTRVSFKMFSPESRSQDLLVVILRISSTAPLVVSLEFIQTSKALAALGTAVASNFLVHIADVAHIVGSALEGAATNATQKCRHFQVTSGMGRQLALGGESFLALVALESPRCWVASKVCLG